MCKSHLEWEQGDCVSFVAVDGTRMGLVEYCIYSTGPSLDPTGPSLDPT